MKVALTVLLIALLSAVLWYVSGVLFIFTLGMFSGLIGGIILGSILNDWFETTRFYKWRKERREKRTMKQGNPVGV